MSGTKPTPLVDRQGELEWLAEVLWGPTPGVELVHGRPPGRMSPAAHRVSSTMLRFAP